MRILFYTRYGNLGASSRVRCYQFLPHLAAAGIEAVVLPLLDDEYLANLYSGKGRSAKSVVATYLQRMKALRRERQFDLLWIEKELLPWLPAWAESLLLPRHTPYVVDYDDAVFHNYDQNRRLAVRTLLGTKIDRIMRKAAIVTVGNDYLGARARNAGAKCVEYVPSVVDAKRYESRSLTENFVFTIGWMGTPVTARYLNVVQSALEEVCRNGKARVLLVGPKASPLPAAVPTELRAWSEQRETQDVADFDVGIMPLMDEPWERGKCGYKLIQYMASGKAVVGSPVGVNANIVDNGITGFHASTPEEWIRALRTLQADVGLRERMGLAGRAKVEQQYSLDVTAPRLVEILYCAAM